MAPQSFTRALYSDKEDSGHAVERERERVREKKRKRDV